jgi:hypothetical protein
MNEDTLKEGQRVIVRRDRREVEAVVAKTTPFNEEFPFVLVTIGDSNLLVHRAEIKGTK